MNAQKKVTSSSPKTEPMVLAKGATHEQLKKYFLKVFELRKNGDPFPVDLDEVWPLVYSRKVKAVEVLKNEFIEVEDFYLSQMGKVVSINDLQNGVKIAGKLSVSCMEYFIAKRVKAVFEVYRQVFQNVNTPINGVMPLYQNGVFGYPRKEALQSVGRSATSGSAYGLKKKFPEQCLTLGRAACITAELYQWIIGEENQKKSALLMKSNQLNLAL